MVCSTASLEKTVAFHVWANHNPLHAAANTILVLDHVALNVGNSYDPLTGVFTAPVSGLYDFQVGLCLCYSNSNSKTLLSN